MFINLSDHQSSESSGTNPAWRHASDGEYFLGAQILGQISTAPGLYGCILIPALALRPPLAILSIDILPRHGSCPEAANALESFAKTRKIRIRLDDGCQGFILSARVSFDH